MKHDDGTVFGPISFSQIKDWARAAQVSPLDKISYDRVSWTKAPMFPDLEMDWLLHVSDDHYYGPTTLSAIQEFIKEGDITTDTTVINCRTATEQTVADLAFLAAEEADPYENENERLMKRVRRLENAVLEDRRAVRRLETRLNALLEAIGAREENL
ncbi:MAG TPA: hypothetical protein VIT91_10000 [Chthoniobacterales bacterium]